MHHIDRLYLLFVDEVYELLYRGSVHILAAFALVFESRKVLKSVFDYLLIAHFFLCLNGQSFLGLFVR